MPEKYIETITMWRPPIDVGAGPLLVEDVDLDGEFEFEATIKLTQIKKSIRNAFHNEQHYCFTITSIQKLEKQD